MKKLLALALLPTVAWGQALTLTASPTSGISPLTVTLSWSATGFPSNATCNASGSWTGARALSGSTTLTLNGGTYTYKLDCASTTGTATATWTAPTQNTDGSTIASAPPGALAGYKLYTSTSSAGVTLATPVTLNDKTATTYTFPSLPVGTNYFAAKAFNTEGVESAFSGQVSTIVVAPSASATASVNVNVQPKPPVLTVVSKAVYDYKRTGYTYALNRLVGETSIGTACSEPALVQQWGASYYAIPLESLTVQYRQPRSAPVAACARSQG